MGTHPIFESDFDCLTEWWANQFLTTAIWYLRKSKVIPTGRLESIVSVSKNAERKSKRTFQKTKTHIGQFSSMERMKFSGFWNRTSDPLKRTGSSWARHQTRKNS